MTRHHRRRFVAAVLAAGLAAGAARAATPGETIAGAARRVVKLYGAGGVRGLEGYQSGILVSPTGHVVTVQSTVLDSESIDCVLDDGRRFPATVIGVDPRRELAVLSIAGEDLPSFAVSQDGGTIVSAGADRIVRVWDGTTGQQRAQLQGHEGPIHALALSPDEALVVSAGADKTLRLWDLGGARQLKILATTPETVYGVAIDPGGTQVAAGGADRTVRLLNLATGAAEGALAGHGDFVQSVAYAPSGAVLLSCGYAGEVRFWGRAGGAPLADTRVGRIGNHAAFDPAGARIVVSGGDGTATILDVPAAARP